MKFPFFGVHCLSNLRFVGNKLVEENETVFICPWSQLSLQCLGFEWVYIADTEQQTQ